MTLTGGAFEPGNVVRCKDTFLPGVRRDEAPDRTHREKKTTHAEPSTILNAEKS